MFSARLMSFPLLSFSAPIGNVPCTANVLRASNALRTTELLDNVLHQGFRLYARTILAFCTSD